MALSVGFIRFVSSTNATQATGSLTLSPVGLSPTEHASFSLDALRSRNSHFCETPGAQPAYLWHVHSPSAAPAPALFSGARDGPGSLGISFRHCAGKDDRRDQRKGTGL